MVDREMLLSAANARNRIRARFQNVEIINFALLHCGNVAPKVAHLVHLGGCLPRIREGNIHASMICQRPVIQRCCRGSDQ